jgi:adenosine deaminase
VIIDLELLRRLPKVILHDHLDGGLRPQTILELAADIGHPLPAENADELGRWFRKAADSGSLVLYLQTFEHTIAVMQTTEQLRRVAREFVEDLAADGVVYAEARWAPEQHTRRGLTATEAVQAVRDGIADGVAACQVRGQQIVVRQLLTSMRNQAPTTTMAELVLDYRRDGVAGFDLAGPEAGFPPDRFLPAFRLLKEHNAVYTIHAGEADGLASIWSAVQLCAANRIGHGVRIADDIGIDDHGRPVLGELASYVRDQQIPLELCLSSNVQTSAAPSYPEHPIRLLDELGFRVTLNCDNRLMSATWPSREFWLLCSELGYDLDGVRRLTVNAAQSAFLPYDQRQAMINNVILPGFDRVGSSYAEDARTPAGG